jgi:hypothetical protein
LEGKHEATLHAVCEQSEDLEGKPVAMNVGCCKKCFKKHGSSFADASWAMGEFMRKNFTIT